MVSSVRGIGRWLAPLLTGVLVATSMAVPFLDRELGGRTPALETEHHPSTCHVGHDHRICTLVGANHWIEGAGVARPPAPMEHDGIRTAPAHRLLFSHTPTFHRSRAPPVV